jgi:hypothetical protein
MKVSKWKWIQLSHHNNTLLSWRWFPILKIFLILQIFLVMERDLTPTPTRISLHSDDVTDLTLSSVIVKDNNKVLIVGTNMDAKALISI